MDKPESALPPIETLTRALDLQTLRIVSAIAETESITGAARALGYSQPAITQHVQRAEARIGTTLVNRVGRVAQLTEAGKLLARHAPRIDAAITAAAAELIGIYALTGRRVRLAAFPAGVATVLAPLLAKLEIELPGITAEFSEAEPAASLELVREGRADIAVHYRYSSDGEGMRHSSIDGLRSRYLFSDEVLAIVSDDFLGRYAQREGGAGAPRSTASEGTVPAEFSIAELLDEPWIGGTASCTAHLTALARSNGHEPRVRHDVTKVAAAIALVQSGIGITFISRLALANTSLPGGVHAVALTPKVRRRVYATTLSEASDIPSVAVTLRLLARLEISPFAAASASGGEPGRRRKRLSPAQHARFSAPPFAPPILHSERQASNTMTTRSSTLSRATRVTAVAASALLLAGCAAPQASTSAGTDTGAEIESITVALPGSLSSLYIGQESGILNYYIASIVQEGLVSIDASGAIQPGLAESWDQTDELSYVYELRQDAKFQDGTPVTADDVVFSLEKARDETLSPGLSYYLSGVDTVEKTGEHEVTITLTVPDASFAANMSTGGAAFITSQKFWESADGKVGTANSLLLGSGPYEVTDFVPDSHVTLERVDTWWGELPTVKQINVEFIPDESTRLLAAQKGTVDVAFNVPFSQASQWEKLDTMRVDYASDLSYVGMYFNTALAPFDDPKVREAFAHSVDREAVVEKLLRGHGEVATAIATPESLGSVYTAEEARSVLAEIPQYDFDIDAAKAALAKSDHPNGFETDMLFPSTGPQLGSTAQSLAENLSKIGITLNVREVPIEEWLASLEPDSSYGVGLMWYFSTLGDPAEVPSYLVGAGNISNYENPEVLALLNEAGAESDPEARIGLLMEVETLQAEDIINVPLWWGQAATAFSSTLGMDNYSPFAFISCWPATLYRAG